jgi:hypothetical protein
LREFAKVEFNKLDCWKSELPSSIGNVLGVKMTIIPNTVIASPVVLGSVRFPDEDKGPSLAELVETAMTASVWNEE